MVLSVDLSDDLESGRAGRCSEAPVSERLLNRVDGRSVDLSDGREAGFDEDLVLGFSSPSWKPPPVGLPVLLDLDEDFGFLMNLEKSPCLLDFPPGTRGFSESFISYLNWAQR